MTGFYMSYNGQEIDIAKTAVSSNETLKVNSNNGVYNTLESGQEATRGQVWYNSTNAGNSTTNTGFVQGYKGFPSYGVASEYRNSFLTPSQQDYVYQTTKFSSQSVCVYTQYNESGYVQSYIQGYTPKSITTTFLCITP